MMNTGTLMTDEKVRSMLPQGVSMPEGSYENEEMRTDKAMVEGVTNTYEVMSWENRDELIEMRELGDLFVGRGWTDKDAAYIESQGRVTRTFNMALPHIVLTEGVMINNQYKLRCYPRNSMDNDLSEIHTRVLNQQLDEAQYDRHNRRAFSDGLIFRRGWKSFSWEETGRYPDGQLVIRRVNPFDVLYDRDNGDVDINRGRQLVFTRFFTGDRIRQLYAVNNPAFSEYLDRRASMREGPMYKKRRLRSRAFLYREGSGAAAIVSKKSGFGNDDENTFSGSHPTTDYFDASRGLYRLIELHERRSVDNAFIVVNPVSRQELRVPHEFENNRQWIAAQAARFNLDPTDEKSWLKWRELPEYWVVSVAPGLTDEMVLMERPYSVQDPQDDLGFAIKAFSVYDQHPDKGKHLGVMDQVRDAQLALNRNLSTREDLQTRMLNPFVAGEDTAFTLYPNDWTGKDSMKMGGLKRYPKGSKPPEFVYPNANIATLIDSGTEFLMAFTERATGINANIQGRGQGASESGVLDAQRTEKAETMLQPIFENMRFAQAEDGRFAHAMICKHLRSERWLRIISSTGEIDSIHVNRWNPMTNSWDLKISEDFGKYDVKIDVTAATKTQAQRVFNEGMNYLGLIGDEFARLNGMVEVLEDWDNPRRDKMQDAIRKAILLKYGPTAFISFDALLQMQLAQMGIMGMAPNVLPGQMLPIDGGAQPGLPGMAAPPSPNGQRLLPPGAPGFQSPNLPNAQPNDVLGVERGQLSGPMGSTGPLGGTSSPGGYGGGNA
jgi:hypothetical protein